MPGFDEHELLERALEGGPPSAEKERGRDEEGRKHRRDDSERREKERHRDGDRDRDRDRDRRRDEPDRREKDRRHRSRSRDDDRRRRERSSERQERRRQTEAEREEEMRLRREKREAEERQRELEELERDTRTVFAYNLPTKADERDIFTFFSQAGTVLDVRVIYDRNTPRSKGMAYIEMGNAAEVASALALTGQNLKGQFVMVKTSEAEKNIAWEAQQAAKAAGATAGALPGPPAGLPMNALAAMGGEGPCKLYCGGLHPNMTEEDVRGLFQPFGPIEFATVQKDPQGRGAGYGFVQFLLTKDANLAVQGLNGIDLAGQPLKVSLAATSSSAAPVMGAGGAGQDLDDDNDGGMRMDGRARAALMARLAGQDVAPAIAINPLTGLPQAGLLPGPPGMPPLGMGMGLPFPMAMQQQQMMQQQQQRDAGIAFQQGRLGPPSPIPTECLLLKNMFDPSQETEPDWHVEIGEDVKEECNKFGRVCFIFVDKDSQGFVYVKFTDAAGAAAAHKVMDGRWFGNRTLQATYQFTALFVQHFPESA